jgi:peroxiredoxin-like protein
MHDFPHQYGARSEAVPDGEVTLSTAGPAAIVSAPPAEFGGPGNRWSPETLLIAAVADCFALSFQAIAKASRFDWIGLACEVQGTLDRAEGGIRFTSIRVSPTLTIAQGSDPARARKLVHRAEHACLITNLLTADIALDIAVTQV